MPHVRWNRRFELEWLSCDRMQQSNAPGVQRLPCDVLVGRSINAIAEDRPSASGQVYSDLMRAPGDELASDDRLPFARRENFVARLARSTIGRHDHAPAIAGISCERQDDLSLSRLR